ncbi:MAG: Coenzyme F420 hydrogenase/dehydrogenase, beta subunit C-terminal domain [Candidatus Hodarchaeota archaeon]
MKSDAFVPLMSKSKGFEALQESVIARDLCSLCGGCMIICERVGLGATSPELIKECNMKLEAIRCGEDGSCYDNCPKTIESLSALEEEIFGSPAPNNQFGHFQEIVGARSLNEDVRAVAQDGGTVTSLLLAALSKKLIEGAVLTGRSTDWSPDAGIATAPEEIIEGAGTKYSRTPAAGKIGSGLKTAKSLAFVGTGCQTTAASKFRHQFLSKISQVNLFIIGLFCFENFPHDQLTRMVQSAFGVSWDHVAKTDITRGKFRVELDDGQILEKPVSTFDSIVPKSCQVCIDFTSRMADISVGAIGTPHGWNTVIVRTPRGKELLDAAVAEGILETTSDVNLNAIKRNVSLKEKKRASYEAKISQAPST